MSVVIVVVLLLSPVIEKRYYARWRYFVWLIIAIRLVIPFNITLPEAPINIQTPMANVYVGVKTNTVEMQQVSVTGDDVSYTVDESGETSVINEGNKNKQNNVPLIDILEKAWLVGAILFIGYHLINYGLFRNVINKDATEVNIELTQELQREMNLKNIPRIILESMEKSLSKKKSIEIK